MKELETIKSRDDEELANKAAKAFFSELQNTLEEEEVAVVSLCGGNSVKKFYKAIPSHADKLSKEQWERVHFFMTDERRVSIDSEESNYKLAKDLFLKELGDRKLLLGPNVHTYWGNADDIVSETERYTAELRKLSGGKIHIPIMGVGPDGHAAALYPGHQLLEHASREYLTLDDSPKPPAERMTFSPKHITTSDAPFVFFISERKRDAYENFLDDSVDFTECPAKLALEGEGTCYLVTNLH